MKQDTFDAINAHLVDTANIAQVSADKIARLEKEQELLLDRISRHERSADEWAMEVNRLEALYNKEFARNIPVVHENRRLKNELHDLQQRVEFLEAALNNCRG